MLTSAIHSATRAPRSALLRCIAQDDGLAEKLAALYRTSESYLNDERPRLLGQVSSHELIEADNRNGMLAPDLERDGNAPQFVFVDEPNCIGCRNCAEVARSTFRMEADFGAARAYQQAGDGEETVSEAIDSCPVDCIHAVSFAELRILERHRQAALEGGALAAAQGASKLVARAEGRGYGQNWREPLARARLDASGLEEEPRPEASSEEAAAGWGGDRPPPPGQALDWETLQSLYPDEEEWGV